ncbi:MAG: hypothetical protein IKG39_01450 [Lachnospiraceae bacterium]|nr:hypothetical protein [Lachnospiraceae bacterium]
MTKKEMLADLMDIIRLHRDSAYDKASAYRGLKGYETGFHDGRYQCIQGGAHNAG